MARRIVLVVLATLLLPATAHAERRYLDEVFGALKTTPNVRYGGLDEQRFDLRVPAGDTATDRPAIVWAHGGGTRADAAPYAEGFARRGYVSLAAGYRVPEDDSAIEQFLRGEEPAAVVDARHDLQAAVRYVRANAEPLGVDPARIVVGGASVGAIAALGTAFTPAEPGSAGTVKPAVAGSEVAAAVAVSGAWDPQRIQAPVPFVRLYHGVADVTVPFPFAESTCSAVGQVGGTCELTPFATEGHDVAETHTEEVLATASAFLCDQLLAGCPEGAVAGARQGRPARPRPRQARRRARTLGAGVGRAIARRAARG